MKHFRTVLTATIIVLLSGGLALAQPQGDVAEKMKQANADLDMMAQQISKLCAQPGFRGFLRSEIAKSKNRENIIELGRFLDRASKQQGMPPGLAKLRDSAGKAKGRLKASGLSALEGYDLYIPVDAHRKKWKGGKDFLVAFSPVDDEKDVKQIVAYQVWDGKRVFLDPKKAPETVALVLVPEEHETHEVKTPPQPEKKEPLPAPTSKGEAERKMRKPTGKESPTAEGNSYFQYRYLMIYNDHEPWTRGDPEIYVVFCQIRGMTSGSYYTGRPEVKKIPLTWVNKEDRYYWTGSSGYLYFYFDSQTSNWQRIYVYEDDGGSSGWNGFTSWNHRFQWSYRSGDDRVGYKTHYKSWYRWGYYGEGVYIYPDAYSLVAKWH